MDNRPTGREKHVGTGGSGVNRRGSGQAGGPVGSGSGPQHGGGRPTGNFNSGGGSNRGSGGNRGLMGGGLGGGVIIIIIIIFLFSRGGCGSGLSSGGSYSGSGSSSSGSNISSLFGGGSDYTDYFSSGGATSVSNWEGGLDNRGQLDMTVAEGSRAKRTQIKGSGQDINTIMVYMCGTDLESRSAMASRDLQEMLNATVGSNINLIVYTGGCTQWQNNVVSSSKNQIYKIQNGQLSCVMDNAGSVPMTDPSTLSAFIKWTAQNYPANRYDLILWDHGGGSNSGYGYDQKYPNSGSMSLAGINTALKDSGVTFDFVGFDACLMATVETGLVVGQYADYMIASEETEPGVGWYYTDWLTALSENPSMDTLTLGQKIVDTYTKACASSASGQSTTLSVVDLAELANTVPDALTDFSQSISKMMKAKEYSTVSNARGTTREFAASSKIDQVDLVHLSKKMGTDEGEQLAQALLGAIKYNQTSNSMTNSYGLSIYFPYQRASKVDSMVNTYEAIGMDEDYTRCIQEFASIGVAGQAVSYSNAQQTGLSSTSLLEQLTGMGSIGSSSSSGSYTGSSASGSSIMGEDAISALLGTLLTGSGSGSSILGSLGLDRSNTAFLTENLDVATASEYIADNQIDQMNLIWQTNDAGDDIITLPEDQWSLVQDLDVNMFYDDGEGYVELGLDNVFDFDDDGNLLAPTDRTWLSIDGQIVSYYRVSMTGNSDDYTIVGRVPAELNGTPVNLILIFDTEHPEGYVAGANFDYVEGETETVAKNLTELQVGDQIDFLCDFYDYDGTYNARYNLGETMTVESNMADMAIENLPVGDGDVLASYKFTDIYGQEYWTPVLTVSEN